VGGVRDLLHIHLLVGVGREFLSAYVSIRQLRLYTSAYVNIRDPLHIHLLVGVGREVVWDERLFVMPGTPPVLSLLALPVQKYKYCWGCPQRHRYSVYLLYWYKSTNTDAAGRHRVGVQPSKCI
jgi:hypothetical protein